MFLPAVNGALFAGVLLLVLAFRSSSRLATAYGVAVTGALLIDTILLLIVARASWRWARWKLVAAAVAFGGTEAMFFSANLTKILHGGWLPLLIATIVFTVMSTWQRGRDIVTANRTAKEGSLDAFIAELHHRGIPRVPGTAVFLHAKKETTPLALRANVEHNGVLHEHVVIVSTNAENVPHIPGKSQVSVDDLGYSDDGIVHLSVRYGFSDSPDIPRALSRTAAAGLPELDIDPDRASYFLSRGSLRLTNAPGMRKWRKLLFVFLAHNAADPTEYFCLPVDRTVVMGGHVDI